VNFDNSADATIADLGENESLRRTVSRLDRVASNSAVVVGPGDDCAVVSATDGRFVVTTDTMVEGVDFRHDWSSWYDIGWKAVATNVSDVAAMGARPTALVVAVVTPAATRITDLEAFADGLRDACDELAPDAEIVGGDLAAGPVTVIAVTAHGSLDGREPVLRSEAKPGDVLAVGGTLGFAACGLSLLATGDSEVARAYEEFAAIQRRPRPPVSLGVAAATAGATSMLDVSDGLLKDTARIARASAVSLDISAAQLFGFEAILEGAAQGLFSRGLHPVAGGPQSIEALTRSWVLAGGEDHSLLATFPTDAVLPRGFKRIGVVGGGHPGAITLDGVPVDAADRAGWDSFTQ
jgi:thiamine-monophosphate kinase